MSTRFGNSLGDVVRAMRVLSPADAETESLIAECLGYELCLVSRSSDAGGFPLSDRPWSDSAVGNDEDERVDPEADKPERLERASPESASKKEDVTVLRPVSTVAPRSRSGRLRQEGSRRPVSADSTLTSRCLEHHSLLTPLWQAEILRELLSTNVDTGMIDVLKLVQLVASQRPIERMPRTPYRTLLGNVEVLVDTGDGMEPFARDQDELMGSIRKLVGNAVRFLKYRDCPLAGCGVGSLPTWTTYVPPAIGTPIVIAGEFGVASSFGRARRRLETDWLRFLAMAEDHDCQVIGLTPYPKSRLPRSLSNRMTVVHWDRATTIGYVRDCLKG
jgi:hypothetical protein